MHSFAPVLSRPQRRGLALVLTSAMALAFLLPAAPASAAWPKIRKVSVSSDWGQGDRNSRRPAISANGRFVAFYSDASTLVPDDTNEVPDAFVRDLVTNTTERVSVSSEGAQGSADFGIVLAAPAISADGRHVAFTSGQRGLAPADSNDRRDVYLRDREEGTTVRVSVATSGQQGNSYSQGVSMSDDGRYIVFESDATNLVPDDTNGLPDVFLRDMQAGTTTRVSVNAAGEQADGYSTAATISADGSTIAFLSPARNLVEGDTNGWEDVFVYDREIGALTRASVSSAGEQANDLSYFSLDLSTSGRHVAFSSRATNLVEGDTNGVRDVFVHDRAAGSTLRASLNSSGEQGNYDSASLSMSADGRHVAFGSYATNLGTGEPLDEIGNDVFVRDLVTRQTQVVAVGLDGARADRQSFQPSISADGRRIAFGSNATNLVPGDRNGKGDVFVRDF